MKFNRVERFIEPGDMIYKSANGIKLGGKICLHLVCQYLTLLTIQTPWLQPFPYFFSCPCLKRFFSEQVYMPNAAYISFITSNSIFGLDS